MASRRNFLRKRNEGLGTQSLLPLCHSAPLCPPLSSLLPHFLPSFHTVQTKLIPPLLIVRERATPDRRVRGAGAGRGGHWGCLGPPNRARDEPAPGGRRAAASPRLAAPERVGRRGGGEPNGAPGAQGASGSSARLLAQRSAPSPTPVRLGLRHPKPSGWL